MYTLTTTKIRRAHGLSAMHWQCLLRTTHTRLEHTHTTPKQHKNICYRFNGLWTAEHNFIFFFFELFRFSLCNIQHKTEEKKLCITTKKRPLRLTFQRVFGLGVCAHLLRYALQKWKRIRFYYALTRWAYYVVLLYVAQILSQTCRGWL